MNILVPVILFAKHLLRSTSIGNISCMGIDCERQWLFFKSDERVIQPTAWPWTEYQFSRSTVTEYGSSTNRETKSEKIKEFQRTGRCTIGVILTQCSMDLVKEATELGAPIGIEPMITLPFQRGFPLNEQPKPSDASLGHNVREWQLVSWMQTQINCRGQSGMTTQERYGLHVFSNSTVHIYACNFMLYWLQSGCRCRVQIVEACGGVL